MLDNLRIKEIIASSILVKSKLPDSDFVINPYVGCSHACKYCYAKFMCKFSGHIGENWGSFVDVKINSVDLLPCKKSLKGKNVTFGSVTDPYQPIEYKYQLTRKLLEKLISIEPSLCVITKSKLIVRDIDLLKQFGDCVIAMSLSLLDEDIRKLVEQASSSAQQRMEALKQIYDAGIKTVLFISPMFPYLTDWESLIEKTKGFVTEYWFENLNIYPYVKSDIEKFLVSVDPKLIESYKSVYNKNSSYWFSEKEKIKNFCTRNNLIFKIYFHDV
jgi:DNA repair photolyase